MFTATHNDRRAALVVFEDGVLLGRCGLEQFGPAGQEVREEEVRRASA